MGSSPATQDDLDLLIKQAPPTGDTVGGERHGGPDAAAGPVWSVPGEYTKMDHELEWHPRGDVKDCEHGEAVTGSSRSPSGG